MSTICSHKKRLMLFLTKYSFGRGSEGKYFNINNFKYNFFVTASKPFGLKRRLLCDIRDPFYQKRKYMQIVYSVLLVVNFIVGRDCFAPQTRM